jgi:hypothetical protein
VAFAVTSDREGGDYTLNLGATMSRADDADGGGYAYDIPSEVIRAQAAQLD